MKKFKKLISNYGFWTGLSAAVVMLFASVSKAFGLSIDNKIIEDIIMSICGVLVVFGVVSIPPQKSQEEQNQSENANNSESSENKQ